MNESLDAKAKEIKHRIELGDQSTDKAEQNFMSAGLLLIAAKEEVSHTKGLTWAKFLAQCGGVKRSRANELITIADGRKSVEEVRAARRARDVKAPVSKLLTADDGQLSEKAEQDQGPITLNGISAETKAAIAVLGTEYRKHTQAHTSHLALAAKDIHRAGSALVQLKALVETTVQDWWEFYKLNFDKPRKYAEEAMRDAAN